MEHGFELKCATGTLGISGVTGLVENFTWNDGRRIHPPEEMWMILADGRCIRPFQPAGGGVYRESLPGCELLEMQELAWRDEEGNLIPDFHLAMRYELFDDGAFFATALFHGENSEPPDVRAFELKLSLLCDDASRVRCDAVPRSRRFQSADIQAMSAPTGQVPTDAPQQSSQSADIQVMSGQKAFERNQPQTYQGNLLSLARFYAYGEGAPSLYGEFFLESGATLSGKAEDGETRIVWEDGNPSVIWNFQARETSSGHRRWFWRNRWGFVLNPPPVKRNLAPQHIYQFIDNYRHYPEDGELEEIIQSGCTLFIIHSNWRRDAANDGVPYNSQRFSRIVERLHQSGIRVAVYCRGNEKEIVEEAASFFSRYLQRDFDGLYVDYAGPLCIDEGPTEEAPGGSILFYRYYQNMRRLRERVGKDGVLIFHTGAGFSNLAMAQVDGYISGEAERGALIRNRQEHEYYTRAAAAIGTLWSAAFPEYTTPAIIPMLAATGQAPHSPLGIQFKSSSLAHPPVPGINDRVFHPLWKIWRLFAHEMRVSMFTDYNSRGLFGDDGLGHCLLLSEDRKRALLVLSDFGKMSGNVSVNWQACGYSIEGKRCYLLSPGPDGSNPPAPWNGATLTPEFAGYPAMAFYFSDASEPLKGYVTAPISIGPEGRRYLEHIEQQRELRQSMCGKEIHLRVTFDNSICTTLENSNFFDLFNERIYLMLRNEDGTLRKLGEIGRRGLCTEGEVPDEERLRPGDVSASVALKPLLGAGHHRLAVQSFYFGQPFYSLLTLLLRADDGQERQMEFWSDLEPDRSCITWECRCEENDA